MVETHVIGTFSFFFHLLTILAMKIHPSGTCKTIFQSLLSRIWVDSYYNLWEQAFLFQTVQLQCTRHPWCIWTNLAMAVPSQVLVQSSICVLCVRCISPIVVCYSCAIDWLFKVPNYKTLTRLLKYIERTFREVRRGPWTLTTCLLTAVTLVNFAHMSLDTK